jgi:two-component system response regulator YesN
MILAQVFVYFNNDGLVLTSTGKDKVEYFFSNIFKIEDDRLFNIAMLKNNNKDAQIIPNLEATYLGRRYNSMVYVQGILSSHNKTYESSLIILTKTNRINEILGSFSSKGAFNINIINNKNEIIASHGSLPLHKGNKNYYSYKGYDSIFRDKIEGIEYIIYHIPSDINELEYVAIAPLSIVIKKAEQFKKIFITTFTSAIIFTMIMVTMVTTKSLDPLKRIIFTLLKDDNYNYSKNEYRTEFEVIENCINSLKHEKSLMQLELQKYNYLQKNNLITALLKGNLMYSPDEEDIFIKYGISFPYSFFRVFKFEIEQYIEDYNKINEEKDYYITPEIILIIKSMMENILTTLKYVSYVVEIDQSKVVILMNINDMPGPSEFDFSIKHSNVNQVLRKIKEEIEDKFGIIITVGIGNTYNTFAGISQSYKEAQKALNFKLLKGKSSIIIFKEINYCEGQLHYYYPLDKEHALIEYLKSASFDKVEEILDSIIEENLNKQKVDITTARFLFYDLQATALKALQELNLSSFNNSMISQDLSNLNTFEEMIDYIKKSIQRDL